MSSRHIRGPLVARSYEHTIAGDVTAAMLANVACCLVNKSSGAATGVTLPEMNWVGQGMIVVDAKGDAATNNITITPDSGNINGSATYTINENYGSVWLMWDGTNFTIVAQSNDISAAELAFLDVTAGTGTASKALVLNSSGHVAMPSAGHMALSRASVAAAGTTSADATALTAQVNAVTGADGAKGVALPAAATTTGPVWVINTDADAMLLVYPVDGGNDNINALAEDAGLEVGPGECLMFVATSATQWYCAYPGHLRNAENSTAVNTLTVEESGKVIFLNSGTEFATTLPAVAGAAGCRFTFIVKAAPSGADYTIITAASENKILGNILTSQDAGGSADSEQTGGDTISFVSAKAVVGDRVDLFCDGAFWYATGFCKVFDAITITTAS